MTPPLKSLQVPLPTGLYCGEAMAWTMVETIAAALKAPQVDLGMLGEAQGEANGLPRVSRLRRGRRSRHDGRACVRVGT